MSQKVAGYRLVGFASLHDSLANAFYADASVITAVLLSMPGHREPRISTGIIHLISLSHTKGSLIFPNKKELHDNSRIGCKMVDS